MKFIITILLTSILIISCVSSAKLSDFSQSSSSIDFDKLSKEFTLKKEPFWTLNTSNEYYFEKETNVDEAKLVESIKNSLKSYNYRIAISNSESKCIIGKRGMVANEWNSITAVYYKITPNRLQVYLNTKISQDVTGGWRENRAMKVGQRIQEMNSK